MASAMLIGSGERLEDNPRKGKKKRSSRRRGGTATRGANGRFKRRSSGGGTRKRRARASSAAAPRRKRRTTRRGYVKPRARRRTRRTGRKRSKTTTIVVRNGGASISGLKSAAKAALPIVAGFGAGLLVTPGVRQLLLRGRDTGVVRHGAQAGLSFAGYLLLRKTKFGIPFLAGGLLQLGIGLVQEYAPSWAGRLALDGSGIGMSGIGCPSVGRLSGVQFRPGMGEVRHAPGMGYVRRAMF